MNSELGGMMKNLFARSGARRSMAALAAALCGAFVLTACGPAVPEDLRAAGELAVVELEAAVGDLSEEIATSKQVMQSAVVFLGERSEQVDALAVSLTGADEVVAGVLSRLTPFGPSGDAVVTDFEALVADVDGLVLQVTDARVSLEAARSAALEAIEAVRLESAVAKFSAAQEGLVGAVQLGDELVAASEGKVGIDALLVVLEAARVLVGEPQGDAATVFAAVPSLGAAESDLRAEFGAVQDALAAWIVANLPPAKVDEAVVPGRAPTKPNSGGGNTGGGTGGNTGGGTGGNTGGGTPEPPFEPWTTTTVAPGDSSAFCSGLNTARSNNGRPNFASCSQSTTLTNHAKAMAESGSVWHSGSDNIVGGGKNITDLVNKFMASSGHKAHILGSFETEYAEVGCYTATLTWQVDPTIAPKSSTSVFCAGKFSH